MSLELIIGPPRCDDTKTVLSPFGQWSINVKAYMASVCNLLVGVPDRCNKARQDRERQRSGHWAGQDRAGKGRARQGRAGQGRAGQGRAGKGRGHGIGCSD